MAEATIPAPTTGGQPAAPAAPTTPVAPPAPASAQGTPAATTPPATPAPGTATPPAPPAPAKPAEGAPEKYAGFTVPKGFPEGHQLAEPVVKSVESVARKLGLSQERAQMLIDEVMPAIAGSGQEAIDSTVKAWDAELANHKELGGAKLDESRATVKTAVEKLAIPGLMEFLESPLKPGHNPALFAALHKVGQWMQQDGFVASRRGPSSGADNSPDDATLAAKLYPKSPAPV